MVLGGAILFGGVTYAQENKQPNPRMRSIERQNAPQLEKSIVNPDTEKNEVDSVGQESESERNKSGQETRPPKPRSLEESVDLEEKSQRNRQEKEPKDDSEPQSILSKDDREERIKNRCSQVTQKLDSHQKEFDSRSKQRLVKYIKVVERLESISLKLAESGVDVSQYNNYVAELKLKVDDFDALVKTYVSSLESQKSTLCSSEKPSSNLDTKKSELQSIIKKDKEIRMYIKDTIISYLRTIKPVDEDSDNTSNQNTNNPVTESPTTTTTPVVPVQ